nr:molybdopterin-guanine dinucleotide biosynthesis protein B [Desulfobacterales bacterium]
MPPIICIIGKSKTGKTTLIERLIFEFKRNGYKVGIVKHAVGGFEIDQQGKDTWRFTKAGVPDVIISSPKKMALVRALSEEMDLDRICDLFLKDVDIIICEGYKTSRNPKIEVFRKGVHEHLFCRKEDGLIAVATDAPLDIDVPLLDINNTKQIYEFIAKKYLLQKKRKDGVVLMVNQKKIPLNRFVKEIFRKVVLSMVSTLKDCDNPKRVELTITQKDV